MSDNLRVIIVEDHEITRVGLKVGVQRFGSCEVVAECSNGRDAVSETIRLVPDVVLMDIGLPLKNGVEATREIKQTLGDAVKVLMLTSHDAEEDVRKAFSAGADGYCLKDIPTQALVLSVKSVASGALLLDPRIARSVLDFCNAPAPIGGGERKVPNLVAKLPGGSKLTARELEVLQLVAAGLTNHEIGEKLIVSAQTIKTHIRHIMEKLAVTDRTQAAVRAIQSGLL
jgi:DNA-binding NarL/FixJ family response regulator